VVEINPNEMLKLVKFLDKYGTSNMNDYRFVVDPRFDVLNLKIDLIVTHLKSPQDKVVITLDP
jgi:hypothetical protein